MHPPTVNGALSQKSSHYVRITCSRATWNNIVANRASPPRSRQPDPPQVLVLNLLLRLCTERAEEINNINFITI